MRARPRPRPHPHPRLIAALLLAAVLPAHLRAQTAAAGRAERGFAVAPDAAVRVWNLAGATHVVGWDRDSVAVEAVLAPGAGRLVAGGSRAALKLAVETPEGGSGAFATTSGDQGAVLEVRVPRHATVWVKGAAGAVMVEGVAGMLDVYTVSGDVAVRSAPAQVTVETMDGDIELAVAVPSARLKTASGMITLEGGAEALTVSTVSGAVRIRDASVLRGDVQSVTGTVTFLGTVRPGGGLDVVSHAGSVELAVPRDISAVFDLRTFDGLVIDRFGGRPGRYSHGKPELLTLGGGAARVTVRTLKGDVSLVPRAPAR